jgi:hypothetical protein
MRTTSPYVPNPPVPRGSVQITGSLGREDAFREWHKVARLYTRLALPFRVAIRPFGTGWALWRCPARPY